MFTKTDKHNIEVIISVIGFLLIPASFYFEVRGLFIPVALLAVFLLMVAALMSVQRKKRDSKQEINPIAVMGLSIIVLFLLTLVLTYFFVVNSDYYKKRQAEKNVGSANMLNGIVL